MSALAPPKRIALHVGAHKTASTHFHRSFQRQNAALAKLDWHCAKKRLVRENLTDLLRSSPSKHPQRANRDAAFAQMAEGRGHLLLPDENIVGTTENLFYKGRFYPRAARRLRKVMAYLDGYDVDVLLTIRDPASFLPSAYGEAIRKYGYFPYADFLNQGSEDQLDWVRLVHRLRNVVGPQKAITVWRYEDYFTHQKVIQRRVLGLSDNDALPDLSMEQGVVRPGISARALEDLKALGPTSDRAQIEQIIARYPKSAKWPGMTVFDAARSAALSARYAQQVAQLGKMDRVHLLCAAQGRFTARKPPGVVTKVRRQLRRFLS